MSQKNARRLLATAVTTAVVGGLVLAPLTPVLAATRAEAVRPASLRADVPPSKLRSALDRLTGADKMTGALATVRKRGGKSVTVTSGTAERGTGRPMVGADARLRIGSLTKPVLAATVMRLVERHKIDLSAPVDRYLPGMVRGRGAGAAIDGRHITVRALLRQTSGLPDYVEAVDWAKLPQNYLKLALDRKPSPAGRFAYANTNYLVLGMVVNAVTGRDFREVSRDLVLEPLGMRSTYWPAKGDDGIRGAHAHTYGVHPANPKAGVVDLTRLPGYEFGASGGLISTPRDLNRFWDGLFDGAAVSRKSLRAMTGDLVRVGEPGWPAEARYGFGIARARLSCGRVWLHGGDVPGVSVIGGHRAGREATVYTTGLTETLKQRRHLVAAFEAALCD